MCVFEQYNMNSYIFRSFSKGIVDQRSYEVCNSKPLKYAWDSNVFQIITCLIYNRHNYIDHI